jgi:hypothetical protein
MDVEEAGRKGGEKRAENLGKKRRIEIAQKAAKARWAKARKRKNEK